MPAPRYYGPIKQIASGHGCGATHWEENAPNPTTPKPNAARIINFVMGKPFCESGEPAPKKLADRRCKYRDQCHKAFDLFARQLSDGGGAGRDARPVPSKPFDCHRLLRLRFRSHRVMIIVMVMVMGDHPIVRSHFGLSHSLRWHLRVVLFLREGWDSEAK